MPYPPQGAGLGDMAKATYDPDADGLIAVAQIEMASDKVAVGQGLGSASVEEDNPGLPDAVAGSGPDSITILRSDTERSITSNLTWTKKKEVIIPRDGTYRIQIEMRSLTSGGAAAQVKYKRNEVDIGSPHTSGNTAWVTFSQNLTLTKDDVLSCWIRTGYTDSYTCYIKNWRIMGENPVGGSVDLD